MIRVLHVLGRLDRGGTESMLMNYYRHLDYRRLQFDFVIHTEEKCDFEDEVNALGGKIYRVPRFNIVNIFQYIKAWNTLFKSHPEYQIIHVHHFLVAGIVLPIAAKKGIVVRVAHSHNTKPPIFILKEKVMWLFHPLMQKYANQRLACSKAAGQYLFKNKPFLVLNNAIETSKYRFDPEARCCIRKEFGFDESNFIVGHIGSFRTRQKNHTFIIEVFSELLKIKPNARLLLVGIGELQNEIRNLVAEKGIQKYCIFAGLRSDVPALLSAMDVFLFPSFFEGLSVVSVEVQASGLPCVASSAITKETCLTDLVTQLDLYEPIEKWVNTVSKAFPKKDRFVYCEEVANAGYDVEQNLFLLERIYGIKE